MAFSDVDRNPQRQISGIVYLAGVLRESMLVLPVLSPGEFRDLANLLSEVGEEEECSGCGMIPCLGVQVRLILWESLLEGLVRARKLIERSFDDLPEDFKAQLRERWNG